VFSNQTQNQQMDTRINYTFQDFREGIQYTIEISLSTVLPFSPTKDPSSRSSSETTAFTFLPACSGGKTFDAVFSISHAYSTKGHGESLTQPEKLSHIQKNLALVFHPLSKNPYHQIHTCAQSSQTPHDPCENCFSLRKRPSNGGSSPNLNLFDEPTMAWYFHVKSESLVRVRRGFVDRSFGRGGVGLYAHSSLRKEGMEQVGVFCGLREDGSRGFCGWREYGGLPCVWCKRGGLEYYESN
jgi:hypothetical protein